MAAPFSPTDADLMTQALELARRGQGHVEPNPLVGCLLAHGRRVVGQGWHQRFGGPHAEIEALQAAADEARGATLYVTLEPCCHQGKTPPCTAALVAAGVARVVVAQTDPFPQVAGRGVAQLRAAGIQVDVGLREEAARRLNAPYLKLVESGRPWVIAKWAMTLDGKLATPSGDSRWISNAASRAVVHQLRGRVDAILVGRGTAVADDPLLTARPPGPRTATRVVLDSQAGLPLASQLVRTAAEFPVLVAASGQAPQENLDRLQQAGCEVIVCHAADHAGRLQQLLDELGRRRMTNVLVEGGGTLLGAALDASLIDEVHVFIAPKLVGGADAVTPVGGTGRQLLAQAASLEALEVQQLDGDIYLSGRLAAGHRGSPLPLAGEG